MRKSTLFLVLIALLLLCQPVFSQVDELDAVERSDSELVLKSGAYIRFLEFNYGWSSPQFKGIDQSFASLGMLELKAGFTSVDSLQFNLISLDEHFAFISGLNGDYGSSAGADEIASEMTRFGVGNRMGYGYGGSGVKFTMYNQDALDWTKLTPVGYDAMNEDARAIFDRYGTSYRFGQSMEAGVKVNLTPTFALTAGAEGAVILPRTIFWPWLGSVAIYSGIEGAIEMWSENLIESSPTAGPVIAFLLRTGVSWGYYSLLKGDMNWPFDYEEPVTVESFKVGANFAF